MDDRAAPGGEPPGGRQRRVIPYPTDHLLAVIDDPTAVESAVAALRGAGFPAADVVVLLAGPDGSGLEALAGRHPRWTRLLRVVQFMTMDQLPDLALYEAAVDAGRAVVAVHVRRRERMLAARAILAGRGGHFVNYFGRAATEELERWRGPELELPELFRR
jgi:hypothetical protein